MRNELFGWLGHASTPAALGVLTPQVEVVPPVEAHKCSDNLKTITHEWRETHGLDCGPYEQCSQTWHECRVCGEKFDDSELDQLFKDEDNSWPCEGEPIVLGPMDVIALEEAVNA